MTENKLYQKINSKVRKRILDLIQKNYQQAAIGTINIDNYPLVTKVIPMLYNECIFLLLSDLSDHTQNILYENKASLYFSSGETKKDRLNNERVSLIGQIKKIEKDKDKTFSKNLLEKYSLIEPTAMIWGKFSDFNFYLFENKETLYIKGFGKAYKTKENIFK
tara:strand:- start:8 stop:496 length:489 start_codon:yes stop_codon:yes gene_type:complete